MGKHTHAHTHWIGPSWAGWGAHTTYMLNSILKPIRFGHLRPARFFCCFIWQLFLVKTIKAFWTLEQKSPLCECLFNPYLVAIPIKNVRNVGAAPSLSIDVWNWLKNTNEKSFVSLFSLSFYCYCCYLWSIHAIVVATLFVSNKYETWDRVIIECAAMDVNNHILERSFGALLHTWWGWIIFKGGHHRHFCW